MRKAQELEALQGETTCAGLLGVGGGGVLVGGIAGGMHDSSVRSAERADGGVVFEVLMKRSVTCS